MAKNVQPVFTVDGRYSTDGTATNTSPLGVAISLAANDYNGAGVNNVVVFTADAVEGGFIQRLNIAPLGTNVASKLRLFINNGGAPTTAANNTFLREIALPATTDSTTALTGPNLAPPLNLRLPAGFRIVAGLTLAVAAGWRVTPIGARF